MRTTNVRAPVRAGSFYPGTAQGCAEEIAECGRQAKQLPAELRGARLFGGIVPHAGWVYSGPTALLVFQALAASREPPETIILFAASHRGDVPAPALCAAGRWRVPTGEVQVDEELAQAMLAEARSASAPLVDSAAAHAGDHAAEVQLPFLIATLPKARFVPVAMPHSEDGPAVGEAAARAARKLGRRAVPVASTDLTHYGPNYYAFAPQGVGAKAHRWSKEVNDKGFLDPLLALDAPGTYAAGQRDGSACGPAAAAAAAACAKELGAARGVLLEHVTSWERARYEQGQPEDFVGYAAVVFV